MPSHYEGFGLPVIEALMCGTDVIISNKTSLPEITEKINKVIDVNDYVSLSDLLFQVPQPITNKIRNELSNRYSWEDVGLKILSEIA
jgi:glycosyltransferase involved in cell wall biosynthesis